MEIQNANQKELTFPFASSTLLKAIQLQQTAQVIEFKFSHRCKLFGKFSLPAGLNDLVVLESTYDEQPQDIYLMNYVQDVREPFTVYISFTQGTLTSGNYESVKDFSSGRRLQLHLPAERLQAIKKQLIERNIQLLRHLFEDTRSLYLSFESHVDFGLIWRDSETNEPKATTKWIAKAKDILSKVNCETYFGGLKSMYREGRGLWILPEEPMQIFLGKFVSSEFHGFGIHLKIHLGKKYNLNESTPPKSLQWLNKLLPDLPFIEYCHTGCFSNNMLQGYGETFKCNRSARSVALYKGWYSQGERKGKFEISWRESENSIGDSYLKTSFKKGQKCGIATFCFDEKICYTVSFQNNNPVEYKEVERDKCEVKPENVSARSEEKEPQQNSTFSEPRAKSVS
eukprot:snap_masked-scaffold_50-processed-gene-0.37-mRNA-1 protein AED:1.00 eAED:1.00 QI:0/-1/0/0/-1/1/1/0/397